MPIPSSAPSPDAAIADGFVDPAPPADRLAVDTARYFGRRPRRIADRLAVRVVDRAFEPTPGDLQRDWVASVAVPAFDILRRNRPPERRASFATIGTGVGLDALAAVEVLEADEIGLTDLFPDVVEAAVENVRAHLRPGVDVTLHAGAGDLLAPLDGLGVRFDVIYENLPNLPIDDPALIVVARTAASFVPPRPEPVPRFVADALLVLHHLALVEARDLLAPGGVVISTLGARLPLATILETAAVSGYAGRFLTFGWKLQAVPEEVIGTYAALETRGLGPFHFFPADRLATVFAGLDPEAAAREALTIERALAPARLTAVDALAALRAGERIGHTVAVLESRPEAAS